MFSNKWICGMALAILFAPIAAREQSSLPTLGIGGAAASSACAPFTDGFSASSGTALNPAYWANYTSVLGGGSLTIVQNSGLAQLSAGSFAGGSAELVTGCTPSSTPYAQITQHTTLGAGGAGDYIGLLINMSTSGSGYELQILYGFNQYPVIYKCVTGTCTTSLLSASSCSYQASAGTVWKFANVSGTLTIYKNGTSCASIADSSYTTGYDGLRLYDATDAAANTQVASFSAD